MPEAVAVREVGVEPPQRGLLLRVGPLAHHDEEVAVAVEVTRAEGEGALQVGADERLAERRLGAGDEVVQHAVELGVARGVGVEHAWSVRLARARPPRIIDAGTAKAADTRRTDGGSRPPDRPFPARIELPDGFQPEGIAIGRGPTAWFGSLADGDIYEVSLRTGEGSIISQGPGTPSVGMKSDRHGRLYVAGGPSGTARVVDIETGDAVDRRPHDRADLRQRRGADQAAAWFTDSDRPSSTASTASRR